MDNIKYINLNTASAINDTATHNPQSGVGASVSLGDADSQKLLNYSRSMIYYAVANDKNDVISLLGKNGIQVPANVDTKTLHFIVLETMLKSLTFKNDLSALLSHLASGNTTPFTIAKVRKSEPITIQPDDATSSPVSNQSGWSQVTGTLDCGVKANPSKYDTFAAATTDKYANQDGTEDSPTDNFSASGLTTGNLLTQGLNLAVAYYAAQGSKAVSSDVNNASAAQAQAAAQAAANKQMSNFEIGAAVIMIAAIAYAAYKISTKNKYKT